VTTHRPRRLPLRLPVRAAVVAAGLATSLVVAGCSATNPIQTEDQYDPSDGVSITLGDVRALNLLVVTAGEGEPGVLHGALTNQGDDDASVTVTFQTSGDDATAAPTADPTTVAVPAGATVLLSGADGAQDGDRTVAVDITSTPAAPGDVTTIGLTSDLAGSEQLQVPVLDGTLPQYEALLPAS